MAGPVRRISSWPMIVVGLTGGIGAGKTSFAAILAERGAEVIDVDALGRGAIAVGTPGGEAVRARFGTTDRRELARLVFSDPAQRRRLEAISWPLIEAELRRLTSGSLAEVVVLDMAVLAQGLGKGIYGPVITVEAPEDIRLGRLVARGMREQDARARMRAQTSESERRELADFVVVNDGSTSELVGVAGEILQTLRANRTPCP